MTERKNIEENPDKETFVVKKPTSSVHVADDYIGKTPTQICDTLENSIRKRASRPNSNPETLSIILLLLDEVRKNKEYMDMKRLEANKEGDSFDASKIMHRWLKSVALLHEQLEAQDQISFDTESLRKVAAYIMKTVISILEDDMELSDYQISKFKELLEVRKGAINQFVKNVAHESQMKKG